MSFSYDGWQFDSADAGYKSGQSTVTGQIFISKQDLDEKNKLVTDGKLKVQGKGKWTVTFKRLSPAVTEFGDLSGTGYTVTPVFIPEETSYYVRIYHSSDSVFASAYEYTPDRAYSSEIILPSGISGSGYAKGVCRFKPGKQYFIVIETSGDWTLEWDPGVEDTTTVDQANLTYSGYGTEIIKNVSLPKGAYYAELSFNGYEDSYKSAWLHYGDSSSDKWTIASDFKGQNIAVFLDKKYDLFDKKNKEIKDAYLEIRTPGPWTLRFVPIGSETTTMNMTGTGNVVTGVFTPKAGTYTLNGKHEGTSYLTVVLYSIDNAGVCKKEKSLLFKAEDENLPVTLADKTYFLTVETGSIFEYEWSLDFGNGEAVTEY